MDLYHKLSGTVKEVKIIDAEKKIDFNKKEIRETAESLNRFIEESGFTKSRGSSFYKILKILRSNNFPDLVNKGLSNIPVAKPKKEGEMSGYYVSALRR